MTRPERSSSEASPADSATRACDLCGLRLPVRSFPAEAHGRTFRFCCGGCRQVFTLLDESGLYEGDYKNSELYRTSVRLGIIGRPEGEPGPAEPTAEALAGCREIVLRVDGMWCSSCSWLIEKVVGGEPGVVHARVMYASDTAKIQYRPEQIGPDAIAKRISALGYAAAPRDAEQEGVWTERKSLLLKMGVALFLMMNLMMFSYAVYVGYFQELPPQVLSLFPWILFGFALPTVFWCASPIHRKAWQGLRAGAPTMELLFSIGIVAAFSYSTYELITGGRHFYFDTSGGLVGLLLVGKFLELSAKHKASESIHRLYSMLPKKVRLKAPTPSGVEERLVAIDKLQAGDTFVVRAGEKIPGDGIVTAGQAVVDESLMTGESKPVEKRVGASVIASSIAASGFLEVRALRTGGDTAVASILRMVERALSEKSDLERFADRISRFFIPAVIVLAAAVVALLVASGAGLESAILRGITVLVIACPCVLGMATPLAIAAGIGYAAKRGILIRDAAALQRAGAVSAVVFDKTGTVTEGKFSLLSLSGARETWADLLRDVASLEQASSHPIASALVDAARSRGIRLDPVSEFRVTDGRGIDGVVGGKRIVAGTEAFVNEAGFAVEEALREVTEREAGAGRTIVFCGIAGHPRAGYLVLGDTLKPGAAEAAEALEARGIELHLLSGDMAATTAAVAVRAGISHFTANVRPEEKIAFIRRRQEQGKIVAMVGDGVNDAPALAQSDVGIAMGSGTAIAVESAPVTLLRDDLTLVPEALSISRRTFRVVKQNLVWAFLYNSAGIVLAVVGLLDPLVAAGAMLASSLSVVANSMRLNGPEGAFGKGIFRILVPWIEPSEEELRRELNAG